MCNVFKISLDDIFSEYLDSKSNTKVNYSLLGFNTLENEDKETIEHLIMYFNQNK